MADAQQQSDNPEAMEQTLVELRRIIRADSEESARTGGAGAAPPQYFHQDHEGAEPA